MKSFGKRLFKKSDLTKRQKQFLYNWGLGKRLLRLQIKDLVKNSLIHKRIDQGEYESNDKKLER